MSAVQAPQESGLEVGLTRPAGLDRGADALEPPEDRLPGRAGTSGVRSHEPQLRTARHRLPQAHAGVDASGLGRPRDPANHLLAVRLGGKRNRPTKQLPPASDRRQQLEARDQEAEN